MFERNEFNKSNVSKIEEIGKQMKNKNRSNLEGKKMMNDKLKWMKKKQRLWENICYKKINTKINLKKKWMNMIKIKGKLWN